MAKFTVNINKDALAVLRDPSFFSGLRMDMEHELDRVAQELRASLNIELRHVGIKVAWVSTTRGTRIGIVYHPKRGD